MNRPKLYHVMVTGAAGLIGSHLIDNILNTARYHVLGIDDLSYGRLTNLTRAVNHPLFHFQKLDVCEAPAIVKLAKSCDIIVHLAARKKIGESQPGAEVLSINSRGTESILEAARQSGCKVVLASTSDVYGMSQEIPFKEDGDLLLGASTAKRWAYAVSKLYDEHLALAYGKDFGVPVVALRYFGCFSERSSFSWSGGHIPLFIDWILKDEEVVIHGDGSQTRSMGYVEDTVRGTFLAMESPGAVGEIINIGNPEEFSVLESAYLIHRLADTGKPLKIKFVPMQKVFGSYRDIPRRVPDLRKAKRLLGYEPTISFEEGLRRTIELRKDALSGIG